MPSLILKYIISCLPLLCCLTSLSFAQDNFFGSYNGIVRISFYQDSTFEYKSGLGFPTYTRRESFSEQGKWTRKGDTVILNQGLDKKTYIESDFHEATDPSDTNILVTFNYIERRMDKDGALVRADTGQIQQLDYAFNSTKRKKYVRVAPRATVRCAFAGYIPPEIITDERTIKAEKPAEPLKYFSVGCYEIHGTKEFPIKDSMSNRFVFNVYSNQYEDGQIRNMKILIGKNDVIYMQREDGTYREDNFWRQDARTRLEKDKQIEKLIRKVLNWANSPNSFDLLPVIADSNKRIYTGFDLDKHKQNLDKLRLSNLFAEEFIENYNQIILTLDKDLKNGDHGQWLVNEIPPFSFASDVDPWTMCQDVPYDKPNPFDFIQVYIINFEKGEVDWKWGQLSSNADAGWKDFSYRFGVIKEDYEWKIAYMAGFDFKESTRKDGNF